MKKNILFATAIILTLSLGSVHAAVTFSDFSDTSGLVLNGSTATAATGDGTVLRLTPSFLSQSGSAFSQTTVNAATFSTYFKFRFSSPVNSGADGIVFVAQSVSSALGSAGGGIGYLGIPNSIGVEFDNWNNGGIDGNSANHVGINVNGSVDSLARLNVATPFDDGGLWHSWIDYDGTTLEVRLNQSGVRPDSASLAHTLDVVSILEQNDAYIGFTSATGGAAANHDIISWEYRDRYNPVGEGPAVPAPGALLLASLGTGFVGWCRRRMS